jgi:hypothetical protein
MVSYGDITQIEDTLIGPHMRAINSYLNLLKTDIPDMLSSASDRRAILDEHIDILKSYYTRTVERTELLSEQSREYEQVLSDALSRIEVAKTTMEERYRSWESSGLEDVIHDYVGAKEEEALARVYITYTERFTRGYAILQAENRKILDTLINNRDAIIKNVVVVVPDSGSDLLNRLNLVKTEAEYKNSLSPATE